MRFRSKLYLFILVLVAAPIYGQVQSQMQVSGEPNPGELWVVATAGEDLVRITALGVVQRIRLEVLSQGGERIYDSGFQPGSTIEWAVTDRDATPLDVGYYGCLVTVEDLVGRVSHRRGLFSVRDGQVTFDRPGQKELAQALQGEAEQTMTALSADESMPITLLAHDGKDGMVMSGRGGLSFRVGDLTGRDTERMRLTGDGKLGIGVKEPQAMLDVAGLIRTSEGIMFPDGTVQRTAAGTLAVFAPVGLPDSRVSGVAGDASKFYLTSTAPGGKGDRQQTLRDDGIVGPVNGMEVGSNTWYGEGTGASITTGQYNSFFGQYAGNQTSGGSGNDGSGNSFFGYTAGYANTSGWANSFFGGEAGRGNTSGYGNCFFGVHAGRYNTTGSYNSFFGNFSGQSNTTESSNSFLGAYTEGVAGMSYATALGYRAKVTRSNSLVLGSINGVNEATADTNVGIGTTSPDRQLVVEGDQALIRFRRFYGTEDPFTRTFAPALLLERTRGTRAAPADISAGDYLGKLQFRGRVGGNMPEYGMFAFIATDINQNGRFAFIDRDLTTERLSILNTGNVGIGTSTPTERLQVVGNLKVSGSILYGAAEEEIPDYVFEPSYKLMTVGELESYLATEKHLPNIPSAAEIREKGLNLSEFQMRLLEKIEELTLYTVRQDKTIREQQARLTALEQVIERLAKLEQK